MFISWRRECARWRDCFCVAASLGWQRAGPVQQKYATGRGRVSQCGLCFVSDGYSRKSTDHSNGLTSPLATTLILSTTIILQHWPSGSKFCCQLFFVSLAGQHAKMRHFLCSRRQTGGPSRADAGKCCTSTELAQPH